MPGAALSGSGLPVTIVNACLRAGRGGSPTAVLDEAPLSDFERRSLPSLLGTSHAVFVADGGDPAVSLTFFTTGGELPGCGHGTVAALAYLAERRGLTERGRLTMRASGRVLTGQVARADGRYEAGFDAGHVDLREPTSEESGPVLDALGVSSDVPPPSTRVASLGRPRLLVPVPSRSELAALDPNLDRLRDACDRVELLGCYVYTVPTTDGRVAARMFAPSIGVPEDIANTNGTACLAAHLTGDGRTSLTVDMGDSLGMPATMTAVGRPGERGPVVHVGGAATINRVVRL